MTKLSHHPLPNLTHVIKIWIKQGIEQTCRSNPMNQTNSEIHIIYCMCLRHKHARLNRMIFKHTYTQIKIITLLRGVIMVSKNYLHWGKNDHICPLPPILIMMYLVTMVHNDLRWMKVLISLPLPSPRDETLFAAWSREYTDAWRIF